MNKIVNHSFFGTFSFNMKSLFGRKRIITDSYHNDLFFLVPVVFSGLIFLAGRYNWAENYQKYSIRGYVSSAFLFIFMIPLIYFLLSDFIPKKRKFNRIITFLIAIWFSLPYHWLNLEKFYYYQERPIRYPPYTNYPEIQTNWLSFSEKIRKDMPNEILFFLILILLGLLAFLFPYLHAKKKGCKKEELKKRAFLFFLFLLILLQTFFHLSFRSPYTYYNNFRKPLDWKFAYDSFLFPDLQGVVNSDIPIFTDIEDHFTGQPHETNTLIIRRAFPFYVNSQFSYFFNRYYSFIIINIILWFIASACSYKLGNIWWNREIGAYMAFFTSCGPGFIMFVAQPMSYLPGYASVIIIIYLFERLIIKRINPTIKSYIFFGIALGFTFLTYDLFSYIFFFLLYAKFRKQSIPKLSLSILLGLMISLGFVWLQTNVLKISLNNANSKYLSESIANIIDLLKKGSIGEIYFLATNLFGNFISLLTKAFLVITFLLAIFGLFLICDSDKLNIKILSLLLILPVFLNFSILYYGRTTFPAFYKGTEYMSDYPRLYYSAYPAIYLLSAGFLFEVRNFFLKINLKWAGDFIVVGFLLLVWIISNIDSFGYLPQLYFYFGYSYNGFY